MCDSPDSPPLAPAPPSADLALAWLHASHDLLLLTGRDGAITWANPAFIAATGMRTPVGAALSVLLPPSSAGDAARDALATVRAGTLLNDVEFEWQTATGSPLWVRARTLPAAGGVAWTLQDITATVLARQSAQRSTELLDMAQELGRMGIWERDIPTGASQWNRHVFDIWGLDAADGTPDVETATAMIHPEDRPTMQSYRESFRWAGQHAQRYRVIRPDGGIRRVHSHWHIRTDANGQPERAIGVMIDDTEVFDLAHSLLNATEQLKLAADLADIVTFRHVFSTGLIHYSQPAFAVLGVPHRNEGVPAAEVRSLLHPDDLANLLASADETMRTGGPTDTEARYRRSDGSWRCIMTRRVLQRGADGEPLAFLGVALDVTAHREALAALRSADERAALAARSVGIGTWEVDVVNGVERWDAQMFTLRELPVRDTPPTREQRMAMLHPDDAHLVLDARRDGVSADESSQYEFRVRLPGGHWRWLASRSIPVRDGQGRTVRRVGVNWDITESKNAQAALQEMAIAERESRAQSQFLSRMSHELRTPLNAVLGFTQLLQRDTAALLGKEQKGQLGHIRVAGEHLLSLINDALELSSLESGNFKLELQPVNLDSIVAQALPLVEPQAAQQQVRLQVVGGQGAGSAVCAWGDPTRVLQVLLNLLSNAVKYNRSQGAVTIETRVQDGTARLRVTDTGRGMTPDQISHLFEPFNRLGIEGTGIEGTGIGLVIVKALVEGMGGTMSVTSQAGRGTSFELGFSLPPVDPTMQAAQLDGPGTCAEHPQRQRKGQLLYIEDNAVNVLLVQELVRTLPGMMLATETTGQAGVQCAASLLPDLVLVDMQLPDFDGFEVLKQLRSRPETAAIPCIALSANAMPEDIARALGAGFEDYWTKPIVFTAFISALEQRFPLPPT